MWLWLCVYVLVSAKGEGDLKRVSAGQDALERKLYMLETHQKVRGVCDCVCVCVGRSPGMIHMLETHQKVKSVCGCGCVCMSLCQQKGKGS
jgi:hypothetical protein